MKRYFTPAAVLIIVTTIFSCKKNDVPIPSSLIGKWSINVDSLAYGIGPVQKTKTYIGVAGDYYDFRTDNKLYTREGAQLDTFNYKVISKNKLEITALVPNAIPQDLFIEDLTSSNANITITETLLNPGGNDVRWVSLVKYTAMPF